MMPQVEPSIDLVGELRKLSDPGDSSSGVSNLDLFLAGVEVFLGEGGPSGS